MFMTLSSLVRHLRDPKWFWSISIYMLWKVMVKGCCKLWKLDQFQTSAIEML